VNQPQGKTETHGPRARHAQAASAFATVACFAVGLLPSCALIGAVAALRWRFYWPYVFLFAGIHAVICAVFSAGYLRRILRGRDDGRIAGTLAFKGTAERRGYQLDDESLTYDAVDGLVYLSKNACPVAHEWYNRVKQSNIDEEPINQTIHDILQAEFATLVTTAADRDFAVVKSLDTSCANSIIPGEVSPTEKTCLAFVGKPARFASN